METIFRLRQLSLLYKRTVWMCCYRYCWKNWNMSNLKAYQMTRLKFRFSCLGKVIKLNCLLPDLEHYLIFALKYSFNWPRIKLPVQHCARTRSQNQHNFKYLCSVWMRPYYFWMCCSRSWRETGNHGGLNATSVEIWHLNLQTDCSPNSLSSWMSVPKYSRVCMYAWLCLLPRKKKARIQVDAEMTEEVVKKTKPKQSRGLIFPWLNQVSMGNWWKTWNLMI